MVGLKGKIYYGVLGQQYYQNTKVKVRLPDGDTDYFDIVSCASRRHISPIPLYHLPRLYASNVLRFNERKQFQAVKGMKQKLPCTNYYGRGLLR